MLLTIKIIKYKECIIRLAKDEDLYQRLPKPSVVEEILKSPSPNAVPIDEFLLAPDDIFGVDLQD